MGGGHTLRTCCSRGEGGGSGRKTVGEGGVLGGKAGVGWGGKQERGS